MERLDTPTLGKNQKIILGISAIHMCSYEMECMTKSIPIQVMYVDSHTRRGDVQSGLGHEQEMISLDHADIT